MSTDRAPHVIEVDDNYLIHLRGLLRCYQQGLDLNYETFAMESAIPSLLAHVEKLTQEARS